MNRSTNNIALQTLQHILLLLVTLCILLQGCAVYKENLFQPAETRRQSPADALLEEARQAIGEGRHNQAEILVERALRIEPDNAKLWHSMGVIRFNQKNYAQCVQFCLKSNSLSEGDHSLTRKSWELIEKAYEKTGQFDKAMEARERMSN